jgi:hypothetical protein
MVEFACEDFVSASSEGGNLGSRTFQGCGFFVKRAEAGRGFFGPVFQPRLEGRFPCALKS